ncbi:MAG: HAD family hydrolase, partial [Elusimicrobiaceae bacterium]|nr:HAD family hydrolase [Elusimicrobiaceae bacterium]
MALNAKKITHVCLDADDTLWQNEPYFRRTEREFYTLLKHKLTEREAEDKLFQTEMANLDTFGYGVKSFTLSMIQTALDVLPADEAAPAIRKILDLGKNLLSEPVVLLPGVKETLEKLAPNYHLAVITKGDLLAQERK